jgi:predicted dehydrogenase
MQRIRIGIIGAGWVVQNRHLPALKDVPGVDVVAIWSRKPKNARQVAAEFDIRHTVAQWQEITESSLGRNGGPGYATPILVAG